MELLVRPCTADDVYLLNRCDASFQVDSRLALYAQDGQISYSIVPVSPTYEKRYEPDYDYTKYIGNPDKAVYFAFMDGSLAGQIVLRLNWNQFVTVDDIGVDRRFRSLGVGRVLMQQAVDWAKSKELPGLMAETQDTNVQACLFYERLGFVLSGFDRLLYHATLPGSAEIALYWYLVFPDQASKHTRIQ